MQFSKPPLWIFLSCNFLKIKLNWSEKNGNHRIISTSSYLMENDFHWLDTSWTHVIRVYRLKCDHSFLFTMRTLVVRQICKVGLFWFRFRFLVHDEFDNSESWGTLKSWLNFDKDWNRSYLAWNILRGWNFGQLTWDVKESACNLNVNTIYNDQAFFLNRSVSNTY